MIYQSLLLTAPQQLAWVSEPLPEPQAHEIVVQTIAGAISIGTELPLVRGVHRSTQPIQYPKMTGYESFAQVIACGAAVTKVTVGQHVVAFYGHQTHAVLAETRVIPVPDDIDASLALLVILSCDVTKGISKLNLQLHESVLVTGAGTIGLLTVFNLHAQGTQHIAVVEPRAYRRALAQQLGARHVVQLDDLPSLTDNYHTGIECSSRDAAFAVLQQYARHSGRICILADGNLEPLILTPAFHKKELQVVGSSDGDDYHGYARWFWPHARRAAPQLTQLFERTTSARKLVTTFMDIAAQAQPPLKVLIHYTE